MLRQSITRPLTTANRALASRSFSSIALRMAEGDTGAPRSTGGSASGDAFTRREQAQESYYIHEKEKQLLALRNKIKEQQKHLKELDTHLEELQKDQGGEKN